MAAAEHRFVLVDSSAIITAFFEDRRGHEEIYQFIEQAARDGKLFAPRVLHLEIVSAYCRKWTKCQDPDQRAGLTSSFGKVMTFIGSSVKLFPADRYARLEAKAMDIMLKAKHRKVSFGTHDSLYIASMFSMTYGPEQGLLVTLDRNLKQHAKRMGLIVFPAEISRTIFN